MAPSTPSLRVLYIEDNPVDADLARRELARLAPELLLEVVTTLSAAMERLAPVPPPYDVVLTDLSLPDGSGMELLTHIRDRELPLAVVIITGSGDQETAVAALKAGADDYLVKGSGNAPILLRVLMDAHAAFTAQRERRARPLRVLYAEPDPFDVDLTRRYFSQHAPHILVEAAGSGEEVLARLSVKPGEAVPPVDVLLLDYRLCGLNALEIVKILRQERGIRIPIVMVTGHGSEDVAVQALRLGVDDYLVKHEGYLQRLPTLLDNAHKQAEIRRYRDHLEELVAERTAQLEAVNRELTAFSHSISHDLRAPIRHIAGFSSALMEECGEGLSDTCREFVARINSAARRMSLMIDAMLKLSMLSRKELERERVDMSALAREIIAELRLAEPERKVDVAIADGMAVAGDAALVRALLENLISNAWKYTAKKPEARIEIGMGDDSGTTLYYVRDNGAGFDPQYAGNLFLPFQRLHASGDFEGLGIGLATVERIVSRHGGKVWAESRPDHGATFYFTIGEP